MFAISLSSCSHYNANFKLDQSVSAIHNSPPYFWDQWGWPPTHANTPTPLVTHVRDHWWTLDFANAFVSPGVNSRGELVPSHGASRRRLGDVVQIKLGGKSLAYIRIPKFPIAAFLSSPSSIYARNNDVQAKTPIFVSNSPWDSMYFSMGAPYRTRWEYKQRVWERDGKWRRRRL
jgi:hypothetical protein